MKKPFFFAIQYIEPRIVGPGVPVMASMSQVSTGLVWADTAADAQMLMEKNYENDGAKVLFLNVKPMEEDVMARVAYATRAARRSKRWEKWRNVEAIEVIVGAVLFVIAMGMLVAMVLQ